MAAMHIAAPVPQNQPNRLEQEGKVIWAAGMAAVASELAQDLAHRSPAEQRAHQRQIKALTDVSTRLSGGAPIEPGGLHAPWQSAGPAAQSRLP